MMNVSIKSTFDDWDDALLPKNTLQSDYNLPDEPNAYLTVGSVKTDQSFLDFSNDNFVGIKKAEPKEVVKFEPQDLVTRHSLIPQTSVKKNLVPALPLSRSIIPFSGLTIAVLVLFFVSNLNLKSENLVISEQFVNQTFDSLVVEPIDSISNKFNTAFLGLSDLVTINLVDKNLKPASISLAAISSPSLLVEDFFYIINDFFIRFWDWLIYYKDLALFNWANFLSGSQVEETTLNEQDLREQIKAEVLADLKNDLAYFLNYEPGVVQPGTGNNQGVVVVPQSSSQSDAVSKIKALFSDPVDIKFDNTGQSGVITPYFGGVPGDNFIFVLTPIKK